MEILQKTGEKTGAFYIREEKILAELVYSIQPENVMLIEHTEVDETLKGLHIGKQLVDRAIEFARSNKYTINPRCAFARAVMEKRKGELADVLITRQGQ